MGNIIFVGPPTQNAKTQNLRQSWADKSWNQNCEGHLVWAKLKSTASYFLLRATALLSGAAATWTWFKEWRTTYQFQNIWYKVLICTHNINSCVICWQYVCSACKWCNMSSINKRFTRVVTSSNPLKKFISDFCLPIRSSRIEQNTFQDK